jgi:ubiquinone/menaquinone biosynthesis C-methylase UbiE
VNSRKEPAACTANFDRLAQIYRWVEYASFGPWLWRCRCAFLAEMSTCRQALIVGDGDGRFTARLLAENSEIEIDAVDASAAMLRALERRAGARKARLRVECIDARVWRERGAVYDLVVTHFFLDCLTTEEVRALVAKIRRVTNERVQWAVSEFAVPHCWFGRWIARPVVAGLYAAFGLMTGLEVRRLPDYGAAMESCGFVLEKRRAWLGGLLVSEVWGRNDGSPGLKAGRFSADTFRGPEDPAPSAGAEARIHPG